MAERKQVLSRLIDVHVHPHDSPGYDLDTAKSHTVALAKICCMSSNLINQELTVELCAAFPTSMIPAFGLHPWFCHALTIKGDTDKAAHYRGVFGETVELDSEMLDRLPVPVLLESFVDRLRDLFEAYPGAMLGEVGLDKSFKIPRCGGYIAPHSMPDRTGSIEWTSLKTPISHQIAVLEAQLDLAVDLERNASVHCVTSQGPLVTILDKMAIQHGSRWKDINVDLHSFGGSAQTIEQLQRRHSNVYFSFSVAINSRSPRLHGLIQAVKSNRLLLESDWASLDGHEDRMIEIFDIVCEARSWTSEEACVLVWLKKYRAKSNRLLQLEDNWKAFSRQE